MAAQEVAKRKEEKTDFVQEKNEKSSDEDSRKQGLLIDMEKYPFQPHILEGDPEKDVAHVPDAVPPAEAEGHVELVSAEIGAHVLRVHAVAEPQVPLTEFPN